MPDPFKVLGVSPGLSDEAIRFSYLEELKSHPPDRDPRGFQEVHEAYERIKNARARLEFFLFEPAWGDSFDELMEEVRCRNRPKWSLERIRQFFLRG